MLRDAVAGDTGLGREAAPIMAAGKLVPDDLMVGIVAERLAKPDAAKGFILDGFPRTVEQAEKLDAIVGNGKGPLRVLELLVPDEALVRRITLRRTCVQCGAIFHLENHPPAKEDVCDRCGSNLMARPDDNEQAVRTRLDAYHRLTMPVVDYYKSRGVVTEVEGTGSLDEVFERVSKSLE